MDEGFIHRFLNIYMFNDNDKLEKEIKEFLSSVTMPKVLVYVKCDVDISIKRMQKRKQGIPAGFKLFENKLRQNLNSMNNLSEKIVDILKNNNITVIEVDNIDIYQSKIKILDSIKHFKTLNL